MRRRSVLLPLQVAPLALGLVIAAAWFSVPGPLRGQMLSMSASGVPADSSQLARADFAGTPDRVTVATTYLEAQAEKNAARTWPETRLQEAAQGVWARLPESVETSAVPQEFMLPATSVAFAPLREFVAEFPDARVDAYLVPAPPMPGVERTQVADARVLPSDAFRYAWNLSVGGQPARAFDPNVWRRGSRIIAVFDDGSPRVWSCTYSFENLLRRAFIFTLDPKSPLPTRTFHHKDEAQWPVDSNCEICHVPGTVPDAGLSSHMRTPAFLLSTPIALEPLPQFTTRDSSDSVEFGREAAVFSTLEATQGQLSDVQGPHPDGAQDRVAFGDARDRWLVTVWTKPRAPGDRGNTWLFTATFAENPHAAYYAWRNTWRGRAQIDLRATIAVRLPWLLAVLGTLLGVSLVASPAAFVAERRAVRRESLEAEFARVQRDAHDRVYNRLTALSKRVDDTAQALAEENAARLGAVADDIRGTVTDLQAILGGAGATSSGTLAGGGIAAQLRALSAATAARYEVDVRFEVLGDLPEVAARLGWDLQCVLEEAITNAVRHGAAKHIAATLSARDGDLSLSVTDDGRGAREESSGTSTGLAGMQARLDAWGGVVAFSRTDEGATLDASIPVERLRSGADRRDSGGYKPRG